MNDQRDDPGPDRRDAPVSEQRDGGSALVEFLGLAVVLLIPVVYLILTLTQLHAGKFAAASAAQSAARAFVTSQDVESAHQRASLSTRIALDDQGFSDIAVADVLAVRCEKQACLTPDSNIWVAVEIPIRVPGIPFIGNGPKIMTASAAQAATVERFRAEP